MLIECLYLLINDYIADGLAMPVMVGGRDAAGTRRDQRAVLPVPGGPAADAAGVSDRGRLLARGHPAALVDLAIDLIGEGYSTPGVLRRRDDPEAGCGRWACRRTRRATTSTPPAWRSRRRAPATCGWRRPYFNICRLLLEEIAAQARRGARPARTSRRSSRRTAARAGAAHRRGGRRAERDRARARASSGGKPLQSVFTRDCIARGRDIDDGGARYNWVECSFVGLANLADSLHVIREEVFGGQRMSLAELKEMLDANFEGHEALRQRFLNGHPKYGNDRPEVDALGRADRRVRARGVRQAPHGAGRQPVCARRVLLDHARAAGPRVRRHARRPPGRRPVCRRLRAGAGARDGGPHGGHPVHHLAGTTAP